MGVQSYPLQSTYRSTWVKAWFCLLIQTPLSTAALSQETSAVIQQTPEQLWLEVTVNRQLQQDVALVLRDQGELWINIRDLELWRLSPPAHAQTYQGEKYYRLHDIAGLNYRLDEAALKLEIDTPSSTLGSTSLTARLTTSLAPEASNPGSFFNYHVYASQFQQKLQLNGMGELGLFGAWGSATSTWAMNGSDEQTRLVRLSSQLTHDMPARQQSVQLGDNINRGLFWTQAYSYAGLQWRSRLELTPRSPTFFLPELSGENNYPAIAELYVNQQRVNQFDIPAGKFTIENIPVINGDNQLSVVVKDILGREQIVSLSYFAVASLLKPGLSDYALDAGWRRKSKGLASNDYGNPFVSAMHRYGLNQQLTTEVYGEFAAGQQLLGGGWLNALPYSMIFQAATAVSHSDAGTGNMSALTLSQQKSIYNLNLRYQLLGKQYRQLNDNPAIPSSVKSRLTLAAAYNYKHYGNMSIGYASQQRRDGPAIDMMTLGCGLNMPYHAFMNLTASHTLGAQDGWGMKLSYTLPLGQKHNASVNIDSLTHEKTLRLQKSLPAGNGWGYHMDLPLDPDAQDYELMVDTQSSTGNYYVGASRHENLNSFSAAMSGGIVFMDKTVYLSRQITDSFAIVAVPGYDGVRVYQDNQLIGRTNARGHLLASNLKAYHENHLSIEQADLGLDVQIDTLDLEATPYYRSGLYKSFPVRQERSATFTIILDNGSAIPAGAEVRRQGHADTFPVGYNGMAYLTGLITENHLDIEWKGQHCQVELAYPATLSEPLPDLGIVKCHGVQP